MGKRKKECPSCAMEVDRNAKECPICGYEFTGPHSNWYKVIAVLLIIVLLLLFLL